MKEISTWFIQEGESAVLELPGLRIGNEEAQVLLCDDRGTLLLPCYVDAADTDEMLLLKQYNADRVISKLEMLEEYEDLSPGSSIRLSRSESGRLSVEIEDVQTADDAM